jgi:hypothetical protein
MVHNGFTPKIEVDPQTCEVRADGVRDRWIKQALAEGGVNDFDKSLMKCLLFNGLPEKPYIANYINPKIDAMEKT